MQTVDFVDEENVAFLQVGEDSRQITSLFNLWTRGGVKGGARRLRENGCQRGFPQARRTGEKYVSQYIPCPLYKSYASEDMSA